MAESEKMKAKNHFIKKEIMYLQRIENEIGYDRLLTTYAARYSYPIILEESGAFLGFIPETLSEKPPQS